MREEGTGLRRFLEVWREGTAVMGMIIECVSAAFLILSSCNASISRLLHGGHFATELKFAFSGAGHYLTS